MCSRQTRTRSRRSHGVRRRRPPVSPYARPNRQRFSRSAPSDLVPLPCSVSRLCEFFSFPGQIKYSFFFFFCVSKQFHTYTRRIVVPLLQDRRFEFLVQWRLCFGHRRRPTRYSSICYSSVSVYQNNTCIALFFYLHTQRTLHTGDDAIVRITDAEKKR